MKLLGSGVTAGKKFTISQKYLTAAVSAFFVLSCAAVAVSLGSQSAPLRGTLPSVYSEPQVLLEEETVPLAAAPVLEDAEPEPDPEVERLARAASILDGMSQTERIYQLFIVTPEVLTQYARVYQAGKTTQKALAEKPVGGLLYSSRNVESDALAAEMLTKTQEFSTIPLFLVADETIANAGALGFNATYADIEGLTIFLNPADLGAAAAALEADLNDGKIAQSDIDDGVMRVLTAKLEAGIME